MNPLDQWLADVAIGLDLGPDWSASDRDLVLDLARDVAHGVARPAAPVTAYLVGIAVGRGLSPAVAVQRVTGLVTAHLPARAPGPEDPNRPAGPAVDRAEH